MKGKPVAIPPAIIWSNNLVSEMPDWAAARECAVASQMLDTLIEVRALLFLLDLNGIIKDQSLEHIHAGVLKAVMYIVDVAKGMTEPMTAPQGFNEVDETYGIFPKDLTGAPTTATAVRASMPPPNFPKPPGFK